MAEKKKEIKPRSDVNGESYMSPTAKKIAHKVRTGEMTTQEGIDALAPEGASREVRRGIARSIGRQEAESFIADTRQRVRQEVQNPSKTQTRKPGYAKGGMVTKANCGASMKPTQKKVK